MRTLRRLLIAVVVLLSTVAGTVYGISTYRLTRTYDVTDSMPVIPADSVSIARGEHLVTAIVKCTHCHGPALAGGLMIDGGPLGRFYAPNLTAGAGGIGGQRTDADLVRAIRHGVGVNGRPLPFMPSADWNVMSDDDVAAIVAYLRALPPVDNTLPSTSIGPLAHALHAAGKFPILSEATHIPHSAIVRDVPPSGPTKEYGRYLAQIGGCLGCHGPELSGGAIPGMPPSMPPASNLTPTGIGTWTEADFFRALREGIRPAGTPIDTVMPISATRLMTDDEIRAVYRYLQTVPPREYGNR